MSTSLAEKTATIANLGSAFECEANTHARYTAFAARADADGWHGVASLFRAAARAEEVHSRNHMRAIRQLSGEAHSEIQPIEVTSTLQNLKVALAGEQHEIDSMYPPFLNEARAANANAAIRCFTWAIEAEKTHTSLFRKAIEIVEEDLKDMWADSPVEFNICPVCGYTAEVAEQDEYCPVCHVPQEQFEVIR
jgi:rubrerythrin